MKGDVLIVKFGGSCLSSSESLQVAARKILNETKSDTRVLVVVSALKGVTDDLLKTATQKTPKLSKDDLDEILSMGERTAAPLMANALKSSGIQAEVIDPSSNLWPIFTNANHGNAEVNLDITEKTVSEKIKPLLDEGRVMVFPGFIGLGPNGRVTTLGRGGSDITAVVLGSCLLAKEVVFVKDVQGILSADPKRINGTRMIESLDVSEAEALTTAGAKVLHPRALKYKRNETVLRVVGFGEEDLRGGTLIQGKLDSVAECVLHQSKVGMVTIIGQEVSIPETALKIFSEVFLSSPRVLGITLTSSSILLYIENPGELVPLLHDKITHQGLAKAVHCFDPLAMIVIGGPGLEKIPGIVNAVVRPLAREKINVYGVMTISSSVRVFVLWDQRERALELVSQGLSK